MALTASNLAVLKSRLEALTDLADDIRKAVDQAHDALDAIEGSDDPLKDEFGKLTPLGVATAFQMFDDGKPNSKIADYMKVSPSAITYQRNKWKAKRATGHSTRGKRAG